MDPSEACLTSLADAREAKERLVARNGVGADLDPMIGFLQPDLEHVEGWMEIAEPDRTARLNGIMLAIGLSDAPAIAHVQETFQATNELAAARFAVQPHGSMAAAFAAGDPDVAEGLWIGLHTPEGVTGVTQRYRYEGRRLVWLESKGPRGDGAERATWDGEYVEAIRRGFALRPARKRPAFSVRQIAEAVGWQTAIRRVPPRNAPCPCGSGRKAKHCCWGAGAN